MPALPGNQLKSAFFAHILPFFSPFSGRPKTPRKSEEIGRKKAFFLPISSDLLKHPSVKAPFAALQ